MSPVLKKSLAAIVAGFVLTIVSFGADATPAHAASGKVHCAAHAVVGMWIEVQGGKSGWAKRSPTSMYNINNWSYNTQGKKWQAHVGCGGTAKKWKYSVKSNWSKRQGVSTVTCAEVGYLKKCVVG